MTVVIYTVVELISILFMYLAGYVKKREKTKRGKGKVKISTIYLVLSLIPFVSLLWLRGKSVGVDYEGYSELYLKIVENTINTREIEWIGIGFKWICKVMSFVCGNNYFVAFAILNTITTYLIYKTILENSKIPWLSLIILYAFCLHYQIFNQFRQMLAIAICFYNFKNLKNRDLKRYIILVLIATAIHKSAIIMLPVYFIADMKLNFKKLILYSILSVTAFLSFEIIKSILANTYYGRVYFGGIFDQQTESSVLNFFVRMCFLVLALFFSKKVLKKDEKNVFLYNLVIYCTLFQILAIKTYVFSRITTYFFIFYVLLIPEIVSAIMNKGRQKVFIIFMIIFVLLIYKSVYYNSSSGAKGCGYDEYVTFFSEDY